MSPSRRIQIEIKFNLKIKIREKVTVGLRTVLKNLKNKIRICYVNDTTKIKKNNQ